MSIVVFTDEDRAHRHSFRRSESVDTLSRNVVELNAIWIVVKYEGRERRFKVVEGAENEAATGVTIEYR